MQKEKQGKPLLAVAVAVLLSGVLILAVEALVSQMVENQLQHQKVQTINRLAEIRARLEGEIHSTLHLTRSLIAYVSRHPNIGNEEFSMLAADAIIFGKNIRNIGLAKDNTISHIYPLSGNEKALGLSYEDDSAQWTAVKRAVETGSTVVAGPVDLVQGGTGFVARTPIYVYADGVEQAGKPAAAKYWGLASIVIDAESLFKNAGVSETGDELRLVIRGKDSLGEDGDIILGDPDIYTADPVQQNVYLPNGGWELSAIPVSGWNGRSVESLVVRGLGWMFAVMFGVLVGLLLNERKKNLRLALHDQLTGLPNRRLLEDRLSQAQIKADRNNTQFSVFLVDMDGFKLINDQHGHHVGDEVLIYIAQQLDDKTRSTDTIARIGGDEFLIVTPEIVDEDEAGRKSGQIYHLVNTTLVIDGIELELKGSIGVAIYPRDGTDIDELLKFADKNMYKVKNARKESKVAFLG